MILYIETILNMTFSCLTVRGGGLSKLTFWENDDCPADSEISYFSDKPMCYAHQPNRSNLVKAKSLNCC